MNNIPPNSRQFGEIIVLNLIYLDYLANLFSFWRDHGLNALSKINRHKGQEGLLSDCEL